MAFNGRDQYLQASDDAGLNYYAMDRPTGGDFGKDGAAPVDLDGIGGQSSIGYGMVTFTGNVPTYLQSIRWLDAAKPASIGALPTACIFEGGTKDGSDARKQSSAYIDQVEISGEVGSPVAVAYNWLALEEADVATPSVESALATDLLCHWQSMDVLFEDADPPTTRFKSQNFTARMLNNLRAEGSLDQGTTNELRWADEIDPGMFVVRLEARFKAPSGIDLRKDYPDAYYFKTTAKNLETIPKTFTLNLGPLYPESDPLPLARGADLVLWSVGLKAVNDDLTAWTYTLA